MELIAVQSNNILIGQDYPDQAINMKKIVIENLTDEVENVENTKESIVEIVQRELEVQEVKEIIIKVAKISETILLQEKERVDKEEQENEQ